MSLPSKSQTQTNSEPAITLGAVRDQLLGNNYSPCSAIEPYGIRLESIGPPLVRSPLELSEHPGAIYCRGGRSNYVAALIIGTRDAKLRESIDSILKARDLHRGPNRTASDGSVWYPLQVDDSSPDLAQSTRAACGEDDPAVTLICARRLRPAGEWHSAVIPLSGVWKNGDLLSVPRSKLPHIDREKATKLFAAIDSLIYASLPPPVYPKPDFDPLPSPADFARPRLVGPTSKRDFLGQEHLARAWPDLYASLPDKPPEEGARATRGPDTRLRHGTGPVSQEELESIAARDFPRFQAEAGRNG